MSVIKTSKIVHPDAPEGGVILRPDGTVALLGGDGEGFSEYATEDYVDSEVSTVASALSSFENDVNSRTTDNITEGEQNLYYTDARADARADGRIAAAEFDASKTISGEFDAARIPNLDAAKISSGTIDASRLPPIGAAFTSSGSNTINVSFDQDRVINREATGTVTFTGSNYTAGKSASVRIVPGASNRTLTFPSGWKFVSFKPAEIAANKVGILALSCYGSSESDVVAAWAVEA